MLQTNAIFSRKENSFDARDCVIEKVIRLSGAEYDRFTSNMLKDQDFIKDNKELMRSDNQGRLHCLLVVGDGRRDGVLVDSSGYDYARRTAFIPNAEDFLTVGRYPALAELNRKLTDIAEHITEQADAGPSGECIVIDLQDLETQFGINLMTNSVLRETVLDMLGSKPGINDLELSKNELFIYLESREPDQASVDNAATAGTQERRPPIEAFIANQERRDATGELIGEWLAFPADADALSALFTRIGVTGPYDEGYIVYDFRSPCAGVASALQKSDSLDELNMLALYINSLEDWELDKMQAALKMDIVEEGAAALINMLKSDNFDEFNLIAADNHYELGFYWDNEDPDSYPEDVTYEEYGEQLASEEKGIFTEWGYIHFRNKELSQEYNGIVPHKFRILDSALLDAARNSPQGRGDNGEQIDKLSVVAQIKAARQTPRVPGGSNTTKYKKDKSDPEL